MASGFPGRDLRAGFGFGAGSTVQMQYQPRSDGGAVIAPTGLLKRSLTEIEKQQQQQQQIQHAIFLRSVKQKTNFSPASTTSSILSSLSSAPSFSLFQSTIPNSQIEFEKKLSIKNRLLELERQLLEEEEEEEEVSISGSALTSNNEWSETMEKLMSPPAPIATVPSPTTSTSSSSASSSSCTPTSRQLLIDTAAAISEGNLETAAANLAVLKPAANPSGDPDQRLTAMMVASLLSRINPMQVSAEICSAEHHSASHLLYEASPCFKLGLMAANLAILDAIKDNRKIHIVDFDIGQGSQLASLINSISDRQFSPPPSVKITAVSPFPGNQSPNLRIVGDRLAKLAERLRVGLRFDIVNCRIQDLNRTTLLCEAGEALAVNFAFFLSRVADESVSTANPRDDLLRRVKSLSPNIVTLVEQEMNGNTAPFAARFAEALAHFGALLESLDATAGRESGERARVEACLARKAANCIAREGPDRVERSEVYGKWRARMGMAGLNPVQLGSTVFEPVKNRLTSLRNNPGFSVKEETGWVGCGWMGRVLTVASAWR